MARTRYEISPLEAERLAIVRARATRMRVAALAERPDPETDLLACLAWTSALVGESAPEVVELALIAHFDARYSWREITHALGADWEDDAVVERMSLWYRRRRP